MMEKAVKEGRTESIFKGSDGTIETFLKRMGSG